MPVGLILNNQMNTNVDSSVRNSMGEWVVQNTGNPAVSSIARTTINPTYIETVLQRNPQDLLYRYLDILS